MQERVMAMAMEKNTAMGMVTETKVTRKRSMITLTDISMMSTKRTTVTSTIKNTSAFQTARCV